MTPPKYASPRTAADNALIRPLLVSIPQAMELLCVSRTTLYELMWSGELTPIRIRRSVRFSLEELERFVRDHDGRHRLDHQRRDNRSSA